MRITEKLQIEALQAVISEASKAQRELIEALDRLAAEMPWPQRTEAIGDTVAALEMALCRLSSRLSRMSIRAQNGLPVYDEAAAIDDLVAQATASEDFGEND
jgi:hypothetical protein